MEHFCDFSHYLSYRVMIRNKKEHAGANQGPERGENLHSTNLYLLKQWLMLRSQSWWSEGSWHKGKGHSCLTQGHSLASLWEYTLYPSTACIKTYSTKKNNQRTRIFGAGRQEFHSAIFVPQAYSSVSGQMTMSPEEIMKQKNCIESRCSWLDGFSFCSLKIVSLRVEGTSE